MPYMPYNPMDETLQDASPLDPGPSGPMLLQPGDNWPQPVLTRGGGAPATSAAPAPAPAPQNPSYRQRFHAILAGQNPYQVYPEIQQRQQQIEIQKQRQDRQGLEQWMQALQQSLAIPAGPLREAALKTISTFSPKLIGTEMPPEILGAYKKANDDEAAALKEASDNFMQAHPDVGGQAIGKLMATGHQAALAFLGQAGQILKTQQEAELLKQAGEAAKAATSLGIDLPPGQGSGPTPAPQSQPGPSQGPSQGTPRQAVFESQVDQIGRQLKASPHVLAMVKATGGIETDNYNPQAVSPKGAKGTLQFMPETAQRFEVQDPTDDKQAIQGAIKYYTVLDKLFPGQPQLQLAGYNAGEGAVQQAGNRIPNIPETVQYVQKGLQKYSQVLGGKPVPQSVMGAPPEYQGRIAQLNAQIAVMRQRVAGAAGMALNPHTKGILESWREDLKALQSERDSYVKAFEPKEAGPSVSAAGQRGFALTPTQRTPEQETVVKQDVLQSEAEGERLKAEATLPVKKELAIEGNQSNILAPDAVLKLRNTTGVGPLRPTGMSNSQLKAENDAAIADTGNPKWVTEKPLDKEDRRKTDETLSGIESAQRIMSYLDDPDVAKLVGNLLSNPEGGLTKAAANIWGGRVPEKYREVAAEISYLTSTILHARIGGQQTVGEYARLKPVIGNMGDVDAPTLKAKMRVLHNAMAADFNRELASLRGVGSELPPNWKEVPLIGSNAQSSSAVQRLNKFLNEN